MLKLFRNKQKIFCISFQRTGTTSVGQFFIKMGYRVAPWEVSRKNEWTKLWFNGDYERIFSSRDFVNSQVFEDDPWWCLDFYRVLYHRFPGAAFILFTRNSDKWFDSMMSHSNQRNPGNAGRHSKIYRREKEFFEMIKNDLSEYNFDKPDNLLELNEAHRSHYKELYDIRNTEVIEFFRRHPEARFIHLTLEDDKKWQKLGEYFGLKVPLNMEVHANATK